VAKSEWNGGAGSFEEILLYAPASRSLVNKIRSICERPTSHFSLAVRTMKPKRKAGKMGGGSIFQRNRGLPRRELG